VRPAALPGLIALGVIVCGVALASEPPPPPHSEIPFQSLYFTSGFYEFLDPDPYVLTKEFAFFSNTVPDTGVDRRLRRDLFHLVYQRTAGPQAAETMFGHAWSRDLFHWVVDTAAFVVDTTRWNSAHVWAPSLVDYQGKVYMFYAGVDPTGDQSIGYASTSLLDTTDTVWDPARVQVWTARDTRWAVVDPPLYGSQTQFRDPFVMADPDSSGHYLMFMVGGSRTRHPRMVVGVARTAGAVADFRKWYDVGALWNTDSVNTGAAFVESPHAFIDPGGRWSLYYTGYNLGSPNDSAFVSFESNNAAPSSPIDPDTTRWSAPDTVYKALGGDQTLQFWHGSEYLNWGPGYEYLGAYDDNQHAVDISQISWRSSHTFVLNDSCPPAPAPLAVDPNRGHLEFALSLLGARPSRVPVAFAVETPTKSRVRLAIYDVLGRRVCALLDEEVLPGRRELHWDGQAGAGGAVGAGIYFARLTSVAGQRVAKVVLLR